MPKLDVSPRLTAKQGAGDPKLAALTRDDVAERLGVSASTVRRLEDTRLHPLIDGKSVRRFKASDVERPAKELEAEQRSPRNAQQAVRRAAEGGFDVSGPIAVADIIARVGAGEYRVSAYGFEPRGLCWEVFVRLREEPS